LDECFVKCALELAVGEVRGDVQQRAGRRGDRDSLVAAAVAGIEGLGPVDPDARAATAGLLADHGHMDLTIETRTKAPCGRGGVMAQQRAIAAREDRGKFERERWKSGKRHH
jgi:hypothetical protein